MSSLLQADRARHQISTKKITSFYSSQAPIAIGTNLQPVQRFCHKNCTFQNSTFHGHKVSLKPHDFTLCFFRTKEHMIKDITSHKEILLFFFLESNCLCTQIKTTFNSFSWYCHCVPAPWSFSCLLFACCSLSIAPDESPSYFHFYKYVFKF